MSEQYDQFDANKAFGKSSARLHSALVSLGFANLRLADVHNLILDHFEREDFIWARRLLSPDHTPTWQSVYVGPGSEDLRSRHDNYNVAESQVEALGFLLEEIDHLRLEVTEVTLDPNLIEIQGPEGLIARVEPIAFEPSNPTIQSRVERSLKGLQLYGQQIKTVSELRSIPGLQSLLQPDEERGTPSGTALIKTPASFAALLRRLLDTHLDVHVKQHQAQELIASFFGASNWQQLIRHADEDRCWYCPAAVAVNDGDHQIYKSLRYFRNAAMGLWALGETVKHWDGAMIEGYYSHTTHGIPYIPFKVTKERTSSRSTIDTDPLALSLYGPPVVSAEGQESFDAAIAILQSDDPLASFEAYLGDDPIESANSRLGVISGGVMRIGNLLFTIRGFNGGNHQVLFLERFSESGKRLAVHQISIESAEVGLDPETGGYCLYHDHPQLPLDGLSDEERNAVLKWAGISIRHRSLTREMVSSRPLH